MADSNRFIEGVYNYCDRWCARCPLSARCRLYAMEQRLGEAGTDVDAAAFWAALGVAMPPDSDFVDDEFDFSPAGDEPDVLSDDLLSEAIEREEQVYRHRIVEAATAYGIGADAWLRDHGEEVVRSTTGGPIAAADAVAVIGWYGTMISPKLARALSAQVDLDEDRSWDTGSDWRGEAEETADAIQEAGENDAAGSAKVALLAIERSLGAWTVLRDILPDRDAEIIAFQKRLARLRRQVDDLFPNARTFIRPGFDDGTLD